MNIEDILSEYGGYSKTGRCIFKHYAYILVAKNLGIDWKQLSPKEKFYLKSEMIDQYAGTGTINEEYWKTLQK